MTEPDPIPDLTPGLALELLEAAAGGMERSRWRVPERVRDSTDGSAPWFRATAVALHLTDLARDDPERSEIAEVFDVVDDVLARGTSEAVELVDVGVIEALLCLCSHADEPLGREAFVAHLSRRGWQRWHQRAQRLEAVSTEPLRPRDRERFERLVADDDPWVRGIARATSYRAENGRLVSVADLLASEGAGLGWRWHLGGVIRPAMVGLLVLLMLTAVLLVSLLA